MSEPTSSLSNAANKTVKRNLPSWMGQRDKKCKSHDDIIGHVKTNEDEAPEQAKECSKAPGGGTPSKKKERNVKSSESGLVTVKFSELLEGVVFALSGFVNPERSVLRSQALEMGAEYQADWNSNCTLLVCAFLNTPKFRQVKADRGTIVSKEWISECYTQKKLVDIESYLMHAGKPWRRQNIAHGASQDQEASASRKSQKLAEEESHSDPNVLSQLGASNAKEHFCPLKVKNWATDDLKQTISWLESQEEQPEPSEIKKIAAEGILTCLQDAIDSLQQKQDISQVTEQWKFIPRVVEELARLEGTGNGVVSLSKEQLYKQAMACKRIYEEELNSLDDDLLAKNKQKTGGRDRHEAMSYDSDETVEMTENEIDLAFNTVATKLRKS